MLVTDLVRYVAPEVLGCPSALIEREIVLATIDLCERGKAWSLTQEIGALTNGWREYSVELPTHARVARVERVFLDGKPLVPISIDDLPLVLPNWPTAQGPEPRYYNAPEDDETIVVYPIPTNPPTKTLSAKVTYAPTLAATVIDDRLASRHIEAIKQGALARLLDLPQQTWTDHVLAERRRLQFESSIQASRVDFEYDGVSGSLRVRPVPFG
jgi:hypothetical protein